MIGKRFLFMAALAVTVIASGAFAAPSLYKIQPLAGDEATNTEGRAITPDGKYVAGMSDTHGVFWTPATPNASYLVGNSGSSHKVSTGIGYRTVTAGKEVVVGGQDTSGWVSCFGIADPGTAAPPQYWSWRARDANSSTQGKTATTPATNSVGGTSGVNWFFDADKYDSGTNVSWWIARGQGDPTGTMTGNYSPKSTTYESHVMGVSGTGRAAVRRKDVSGGQYQNYYYDWAAPASPVGVKFKGLQAGTFNGQPWDVSDDGAKVAGYCPVDGGRTGNWPFLYTIATDTIVELPTLNPNNTGAYATNGIVYGLSADGRYAAGMDYTLGGERAVLWDTQLMTELDLTQFALDNGILGTFAGGNLRRAYSVGVNALGQPVVTGWGWDTAVSLERGFVLTVPEPATLAVLALGGLALLRRRR